MLVPIDLGDDPSLISNYYQYIDLIIDKIGNFTGGQIKAFYSLSAAYYSVVNQ